MAAITGALGDGGSTRADWTRKYPPMFTMAVALLIAIVVLPSSLNLPQSNPTETLEYAPVPPDDENDPPPSVSGNFGGLGLGRSAGIGSGDGEGVGEGAAPPTTQPRQRQVIRRSGGGGGSDEPPPPPTDPDFRCVGDPPRQTIDPLSPPCVPFFEGDNGCATYGVGVTCDEVKLVAYMEGGINYINGSDVQNRVTPGGAFYDLMLSPEQNQANNDLSGQPEHLQVKAMRVWQTYFNQRFQTYGRRVHFYVYFSDGGASSTPEGRRRDAAEIFDRVKPFAVISLISEGAEDAFLRAMAGKGVLNFGSFGLRPQQFFRDFPKMIWSYLPSIEQQAEVYISYICQKVVGQPPVLAADDLKQRAAVDFNNQRRIGFIWTTDQDWSGLTRMGEMVRTRIQQQGCGPGNGYRDPKGEPIPVANFPECCVAQDNGEPPDYAVQAMADFKLKGVTTILWIGGINGNYGKTAAANGYFPEWVIAGDGLLDANRGVILSQNSNSFDGRAIAVTPQLLEPGLEQRLCARAFREVAPNYPNTDLAYVCNEYYNLFQFFVGVQVSGPKLGPTNLDKGFHAIPQRLSGQPEVPACFYLVDDYTCVKDAQAEIWSAEDRPPGTDASGAPSTPGCWQAIKGDGENSPYGARFRLEWPAGNINQQLTGQEPCNGYSASVRFNIA